MFTTVICLDTNEKAYTYEEYLVTKHWRIFREAYISCFGENCEICGNKGEELHHLNYNNIGHEQFDDAIFLCRACHKKEHIRGIVL